MPAMVRSTSLSSRSLLPKAAIAAASPSPTQSFRSAASSAVLAYLSARSKASALRSTAPSFSPATGGMATGFAVQAAAEGRGPLLVGYALRPAGEEGQPPAGDAGVEHEADGIDVRRAGQLAVPEEFRGHVFQLVRAVVAGAWLAFRAQRGGRP